MHATLKTYTYLLTFYWMYNITVTCKLFRQPSARSSIGLTAIISNWRLCYMTSELNEKQAPDCCTFHMSAHRDTEGTLWLSLKTLQKAEARISIPFVSNCTETTEALAGTVQLPIIPILYHYSLPHPHRLNPLTFSMDAQHKMWEKCGRLAVSC